MVLKTQYKPYPSIDSSLFVCYSFGSVINELQYSYVAGADTAKYRYGFNNQEQDKELGDYYAFEYRVHDARLGRFLSVDPLAREFHYYSPYHFAGNSPIWAIELEGLEPEITSCTSGDNNSTTVYTLEDKSTGYKGTVTLDGSNGDNIENNAEGKVISYKKDGVLYTWNSTNNNYSESYYTFKGGRCITTRARTFSQKFSEFEYQWTSPNGDKSHILQNAFKTFVGFSPQASLMNTAYGVSNGTNMWGQSQNGFQTSFEILSVFPVFKLGKVVVRVVDASIVLKSANAVLKSGLTVVGHAIQKHSDRFPTVWGSIFGNSQVINDIGMRHLNEILKGPGEFIEVVSNGIHFLEKRLPDGRGVRLNMDGTFKGFVDLYE